MSEVLEPTSPVPMAYQLLGQNPNVILFLLLILGGAQGVDLIGGFASATEVREVRDDLRTLTTTLDGAVEEITDHSDRISRLERRVDELTEDNTRLRSESEGLRVHVISLRDTVEDVGQ